MLRWVVPPSDKPIKSPAVDSSPQLLVSAVNPARVREQEGERAPGVVPIGALPTTIITEEKEKFEPILS